MLFSQCGIDDDSSSKGLDIPPRLLSCFELALPEDVPACIKNVVSPTEGKTRAEREKEREGESSRRDDAGSE